MAKSKSVKPDKGSKDGMQGGMIKGPAQQIKPVKKGK